MIQSVHLPPYRFNLIVVHEALVSELTTGWLLAEDFASDPAATYSQSLSVHLQFEERNREKIRKGGGRER